MKIKTTDGFVLDATFNEVPGSNKGVIFAHGITVDKDDEGIFVRASTELQKHGISTLLFSFRGHGNSSGESTKDFTISGQLIDLQSAFDFMESKGVTIFGLGGASFGGGASALYTGAHLDSIKALLLANPALNYEQAFLKPTTSWSKKHFSNNEELLTKQGFVPIGSRAFKAGPKLFDEMRQFKPYESLEQYKGPLLVVQGTEDSKIAYQDVESTITELSNPNKQLEIIQGSEHGFHDEPYETQVTDMVVNFFKDNL